MSPVLGPLVDRLARLWGAATIRGPGGSAYISGWYGYVDKDLRALLDQPARGPYSRRYRGAGRIPFTSGVLPDTMRWTTRPTFQQIISFSGRRPRG